MPTPDTCKTKPSLPGLNEQATTGKEKAIDPKVSPNSPLVIEAAPKNKLRRVKVREDIDSDYAEEAEDFFYGEGM